MPVLVFAEDKYIPITSSQSLQHSPANSDLSPTTYLAPKLYPSTPGSGDNASTGVSQSTTGVTFDDDYFTGENPYAIKETDKSGGQLQMYPSTDGGDNDLLQF